MSRAFVSDTDSDFEDAEIPEIKIPLPPGARNYMTLQGAERLRKELVELTGTMRPQAAAELGKHLAGGSNTERDARATARHRLLEIDRRIEYLSRMKSLLEVVRPPAGSPERVSFGTTVTVEQGGAVRSYTIVGVDESDPEHGRISWISPLAKALMGAHLGDLVAARLPCGEIVIRITAISGD